MSEDDCKFELPKGWYEDTVYTNWVKVLTIRIEEPLISEFLEDLEKVSDNYFDEYTDGLTLGEVMEKWEEKLK